MTKSMTAFGKGSFSSEVGEFTLEIYSVNKKNLDVSTLIPKDFFHFDHQLRKWVLGIASRGSISVRLMKEHKAGEVSTEFDANSLAALKEQLESIAGKLGLEPPRSIEVLADIYLRTPHRERGYDKDKFLTTLKTAFDEAAGQWAHMREREGEHLASDIRHRLEAIGRAVSDIEKNIDRAPQKYAERLKKRLDDAKVLEHIEEERVIKEVVIFSEKVDTTEEIIRLQSHISQFESALNGEDGAIGRKLDFLIQEMNREVNSLGVKCQDLIIVKQVLEVKSELEKIREQVQNIE